MGTLALIRSSPTAMRSSVTTSLPLPRIAADFISPAHRRGKEAQHECPRRDCRHRSKDLTQRPQRQQAEAGWEDQQIVGQLSPGLRSLLRVQQPVLL